MPPEEAPVAPAPVEVAPVAPVIETPAAEAPASIVEAPVETPTPAPEPVVAEPEAPAAPVPENPLTTEGDAPAPEPEAPAEPVAPEPITYDLKLPDGIEAVPEQMAEFTGMLNEARVPPEQAQRFLDLHTKSLTEFATYLTQHNADAYQKLRGDWRGEFRKLAGNAHDTMLDDARHARDLAFPDKKQRENLIQALDTTGAGDNPHVLQAFAILGKKLRERSAPARPLPAQQAPLSKPDQRYGRTNARN